jgi:hypothetical protein
MKQQDSRYFVNNENSSMYDRAGTVVGATEFGVWLRLDNWYGAPVWFGWYEVSPIHG